ncbi:MAG: hypothetical protein ABFD82_02925 [Syntrophaceae bacterium]
MTRHAAISFENNLIKVVYASSDKGKTIVQKTLSFKDDEFDSFLKTTKLPDLTVVCSFKRFYSDIMIAPPTKPAYLKKIVETEIRKRFPELNDFSFFFCVLSEKTALEKETREVFFYAVDNNELNEITERFNKYGKSVKYIYPNVLTLSQLIKSSAQWGNKTVLSIFVSEKDRTLFLVKNGEICFIRVTPSLGAEINNVDIDNINMTVSYCRQNLRLTPDAIVLMNTEIKEDIGKTVIPAVSVTYPTNIFASEEILKNFASSISALIFGQKLRNENLLPLKYRVLQVQKLIASYSIIFFVLFSLIGLSFSIINLSQISQINEKINFLRSDLGEIDAITSTYEKDMGKMQQILPLINYVKEAQTSPDIQKTLISLNFLPMDGVHVQSIQVNNKKNSLHIQMTGIITAKSYGDMHRVFIKLLNNFNAVLGMTVITKNIELKNGNFQIDIENKI